MARKGDTVGRRAMIREHIARIKAHIESSNDPDAAVCRFQRPNCWLHQTHLLRSNDVPDCPFRHVRVESAADKQVDDCVPFCVAADMFESQKVQQSLEHDSRASPIDSTFAL